MQHTQHKNRFDVRTLALIGIMAALVFALSWVSIPIPAGPDGTRIHFGNIMCLLGGVLFGPWVGGLAAGFGSMLFDLTNPAYIAECWITFLTKFAMGFAAGWLATRPLARLPLARRTLLAGIGGQLTYIVLYTLKNLIFQRVVYGLAWEAVFGVVAVKLAVSSLNGVIAVVGCTILAPVLRKALDAAGLFKNRAV